MMDWDFAYLELMRLKSLADDERPKIGKEGK